MPTTTPTASQLTRPKPSLFWGYVALVAVYITWSTTFGAMRVGLNSLHPSVLVAQRYGWTVLLFAPFVDKRVWRLPAKALLANGLAGLLMFGVGNSLTPFNLQIIPTGVAAAVVALNPFWMIALSWVLPPREQVSPSIMAALILGFSGLMLVLSPDIPHWFSGHRPIISAVILQMVAGLAWCWGSMISRQMHQTVDEASHTGFRFQLGLVVQQNIVAVVLMTLVATWQGLHPWDYLTHLSDYAAQPSLIRWPSVFSVLYLVVFGSGIGMVGYLYSLQTLPLALTGTFAYVTPVLTAALGVWLLNEPSHWQLMVGMGVIVISVVLIQWLVAKQAMPAHDLSSKDAVALVDTLEIPL
ncbi:MAG: EamA family transporter [Vampirovibrionales bacterium]|nr:EamA family transporter [Vampirovibrionales bacterium]